jgi:hypothetical protein
MIGNHTKRLRHASRRMLVVVAAVVVPAAILGSASQALASEHHPTGNFAPFAQCPLSNPSVTQCVVASTTSGEFTVGKKTVPINKTITLQGGTIPNHETGELMFVGAENGETLSKTALEVPGGLFGINCKAIENAYVRSLCEFVFNNKLTGVTETTELAGPPSDIKLSTTNLIFEEGIALELPVKVKLGNPLFGEHCYVGSESNPIILKLTTGTTEPPEPNKPISGSAGELEILEEGALLRLIGGSLVDNSFSAPGANGCGGVFSAVVDPIVDSAFGVPAAAGLNTVILTGTLEDAYAPAVRESEEA